MHTVALGKPVDSPASPEQPGIREPLEAVTRLVMNGVVEPDPWFCGRVVCGRNSHIQMNIDRLFIAGFQKSGTTSLHEVLVCHPGVRAGDPAKWPDSPWRSKEPHFFNVEWERGLDWYESLFLPGGCVRLDSTPNLLSFEGGVAVRRIRKHFPDARFIALMRDPVERAFSAWNHWRSLPPERRWSVAADARSFERTMRLQIECEESERRFLLEDGFYIQHLRGFATVFPRDQILPVFTSHLENGFAGFMERVAAFAGLGSFDWNPRRVHVRNPSGWRPDRATAALLREIYRPHNEALAEWLNEDLPWVRETRPKPPSADRVFRLQAAPQPPARQRVRIVLPLLHSAADNEAHARAVAAMVADLFADGHEVRVLVGRTRAPYPKDLTERYLSSCKLDFMGGCPPALDKGGPAWTVQSVAILRHLGREKWDTLVLPAAEGTAYATLQWLRQGHHPHPCRASIYLAGRAPLHIHRARMAVFARHPHEFQRDWLERRCLELADDVLLPDADGLDICREAGWSMPESCHLGLPGLSPALLEGRFADERPWLVVPEDDLLAASRFQALLDAGFEPARHCGGCLFPGSDAHARRWEARIGIKSSPLSAGPAPGTQIVMLSPAGLHPWLTADLFQAGLVPVAPEARGPELLRWESLRPVAATWNPGKWRKFLRESARAGEPYRLTFSPPNGYSEWRAGFSGAPAPRRFHAAGLAGSVPKVSICMATYNRTTEFEQTLRAFRDQDWPNIEMVVVNDGSFDAAALALHESLRDEFAREGWIWHDQENAGPAAARNKAGVLARGGFVIFADDDNIPLPGHVRTLMTTLLASGCDIALAHMVKFSTPEPPDRFEDGDLWWMPVGGDLTYGVFGNGFGETSMAMKKNTFLELGGFPPDREPGRVIEEDRLILTRAALRGLEIAHYPLPTYWYRENAMARHHQYLEDPWSCQAATVDMLAGEGPAGFRGLFEFAAGQWDYRKNDLFAQADTAAARRLARARKEASRWRLLALGLAAEARRLLRSKRWRAANFSRLHRPLERTFPALDSWLRKVERQLSKSKEPPFS